MLRGLKGQRVKEAKIPVCGVKNKNFNSLILIDI